MARIRSVHPGLWTDEDFVQLSAPARLFLIGMWNESDDYGLFEWKPTRLKMRLAPNDPIDAAALMAELVEHFQWLTPEESDRLLDDAAKRQAVEEEMADVLLYLLRLADITGVDLNAAMTAKIVKNAQKHPPLTSA